MNKALLIVDMQNDFMPGGALPVPGADQIIPEINRYMEAFDLIVATQDWHPQGHSSFLDQKGPWPVHCVQGERGAELVSQLNLKPVSKILRKGLNPLCDSYSAFFDAQGNTTGLSSYLRALSVKEVHCVGVATDVCVYFTVLDALKEGFSVSVYEKGCRGLQGSFEALQKMESLGAQLC